MAAITGQRFNFDGLRLIASVSAVHWKKERHSNGHHLAQIDCAIAAVQSALLTCKDAGQPSEARGRIRKARYISPGCSLSVYRGWWSPRRRLAFLHYQSATQKRLLETPGLALGLNLADRPSGSHTIRSFLRGFREKISKSPNDH